MPSKDASQLATISGIADADLVLIHDVNEPSDEQLKSIEFSDFKTELNVGDSNIISQGDSKVEVTDTGTNGKVEIFADNESMSQWEDTGIRIGKDNHTRLDVDTGNNQIRGYAYTQENFRIANDEARLGTSNTCVDVIPSFPEIAIKANGNYVGWFSDSAQTLGTGDDTNITTRQAQNEILGECANTEVFRLEEDKQIMGVYGATGTFVIVDQNDPDIVLAVNNQSRVNVGAEKCYFGESTTDHVRVERDTGQISHFHSATSVLQTTATSQRFGLGTGSMVYVDQTTDTIRNECNDVISMTWSDDLTTTNLDFNSNQNIRGAHLVTGDNGGLLMDGTGTVDQANPTSSTGSWKKRITCNDGGGNWNFRAGHYFKSGVDEVHHAGDGAAAMILSTDAQSGVITFRVADTEAVQDTAVDWKTQFVIGTANYNGRWYQGTTNPTGTTRMNYSGYLYATQLYDNGSRVLNEATGLLIRGLAVRPEFIYLSSTSIQIGAGTYHLNGSSEKMVYWTSAISKTVSVTGTQWYYLYLDDSAIPSSGVITSSSHFTYNTTAPTFSHSRGGWYNGNDRCIFGFHVNGGVLQRFRHVGTDYVQHQTMYTDYYSTGLTSNWTLVNLTIPGFSERAKCGFRVVRPGNAEDTIQWRTDSNGSAHYPLGRTRDNGVNDHRGTDIVTATSAKQIQIREESGQNNYFYVYTHGWYFPQNM